MVFDDHEVTDDWNLNKKWERRVKKLGGNAVLANGLAAYWAFQGWGNDPERTGGRSQEIALATRSQSASLFEIMSSVHWSYRISNLNATVLDTRTKRGAAGAMRGPRLMNAQARSEIRRLGPPLVSRPHLIVAPGPIMMPGEIEFLSGGPPKLVPYFRKALDYEGWATNEDNLDDLVRLIQSWGAPMTVAIGGDVHFSHWIDCLIGNLRTKRNYRLIAVCSSPTKNEHGSVLSSVLRRPELSFRGRFQIRGNVLVTARPRILGTWGFNLFVETANNIGAVRIGPSGRLTNELRVRDGNRRIRHRWRFQR